MHKHSLWSSLVVIAFGITVIVLASSIPTVKAIEKTGVVNSQFFPRLMGIFFVGLGGVLAVQALLARRSSQKKYVHAVSGISIKTLSGAIALSVVYALLFRAVGFPIMTFAVVACFSFLLGARNFVIPIVSGLVVSAILYAAFRYLLGVVVPAGVLSGIL